MTSFPSIKKVTVRRGRADGYAVEVSQPSGRFVVYVSSLVAARQAAEALARKLDVLVIDATNHAGRLDMGGND